MYQISYPYKTVPECPPNSHFEAAGIACANTCRNRQAANRCTKPKVEGLLNLNEFKPILYFLFNHVENTKNYREGFSKSLLLVKTKVVKN